MATSPPKGYGTPTRMIALALLISALTLGGADFSTAAASTFEYAGYIGGTLNGAALYDHYAYVTEGPTLAILDVADMAHPVRAGVVRLPYDAGKVVIYLSRAFILYPCYDFIQIYDLSQPLAPRLLGQIDAPTLDGWDVDYPYGYAKVYDLAVSGNNVLLTGNFGIVALDAANPASPQYNHEWQDYEDEWDDFGDHSIVPVWTANAAAISGNLALCYAWSPQYPTEYAAGFYCFDLTSGTQLNSLNLQPKAAILEGRLAYLAMGSGGLQIYDYTDLAHPKLKASLAIPGNAIALKKEGSQLYVGTDSGLLQVVSTNDPGNPVLIGSVAAASSLADMDVLGTRAFILENESRARCVDVSNPAAPAGKGDYTLVAPSFHTRDVVVRGDLAYVGSYDQGLKIFNLSDPLHPRQVGEATSVTASMLRLSGNTLYASNRNRTDELLIIDVSDPSSPRQVGRIAGNYGNMVVEGTMIYAKTDLCLQIIDAANPAAPRLRGRYSYSVDNPSLAIHGSWLCLTDETWLHILDVSNPDAPFLIGELQSTWGDMLDMTILDGWGCTASCFTSSHPLWILDLRNPAFPLRKTSVSVPVAPVAGITYSLEGFRIVQAGHTLFLCCNCFVRMGSAYVYDSTFYYLVAFDASDPTAPRETARWNKTSGMLNLAASGRMVYLISINGDLDILRYTGPMDQNGVGNSWVGYH